MSQTPLHSPHSLHAGLHRSASIISSKRALFPCYAGHWMPCWLPEHVHQRGTWHPCRRIQSLQKSESTSVHQQGSGMLGMHRHGELLGNNDTERLRRQRAAREHAATLDMGDGGGTGLLLKPLGAEDPLNLDHGSLTQTSMPRGSPICLHSSTHESPGVQRCRKAVNALWYESSAAN